jgi:hypothetical protein
MKLNPKKAALTVGSLFALVHIVWSVLVALGWAQAVSDFVLWAHMVTLPHTVGPFDWTASLTVIILSFLIGGVLGAVFSKIWNHFSA